MRERLQKLIDEEMHFINAIPDFEDFLEERLSRELFAHKVEAAISPQWVPVLERLPDEFHDVIVWDGEDSRLAYRRVCLSELRQKQMTTTMIRLTEARQLLAKASTLEDVLQIRDKAAAIKTLLASAGESLKIQNQAAEIKLRAERKAGTLLAEMDKAVGSINVENTANSGADTMSAPKQTTLSDIGLTHKQSSRFQQEAKLSEEQFDQFVAEVNQKGEELAQSALLKAARGPHVANNSCDNEWYTPEQYIKPFRNMVGKIDLDPASCEEANAVVKAKRFYSIDDDGLRKKWTGSVWLNPPYAAGVVETFIAKLITEIDSGSTTSAALLVNNATETRWFQMALNRCNACCFLASRIKFWKPGKSTNTPLQGQCILYFGGEVDRFDEAYSSLGVTLVRESN